MLNPGKLKIIIVNKLFLYYVLFLGHTYICVCVCFSNKAFQVHWFIIVNMALIVLSDILSK